MQNRRLTETPKADALRAHNPAQTELTDTELQSVSGGINPQPLPPRRDSHS